MDLENTIVSKLEKKDKYYIICMWNLKNNTHESMYKTEQTQTQKKFMVTKGKREKENKSEV